MAGDPTGRISHTHEFHRGFSWKPAARVATTANITLSGTQTIDGVSVVAEDVVLVKNQSTGSQNGLYWCKAGAWVRHASMDQDGTTSVPAEEVLGSVIFVIAGSTNGQTLWRNTNTSAPTLGTTALTFAAVTTSSLAASAVTVADAGGYYVGTDAETVLQDIGAQIRGYSAHGNLGSTETFSAVTAGWHSGTLNANCTFTLTALSSGLVSAMVLELVEDGTGGWTITLPSSVVNHAALEAAFVTTASTTSLLLLYSRDGGTTWFGFIAGGGSTVAALDDLSDVTITSPAYADRLRYTGSVWANSALRWEPLVDYTGSVLIDGAGNPQMAEVS